MTMKSKTTMKSTSVGAKIEVFGTHFGRIRGGFGVVLELGRHHLGGRNGTWTQVRSKGRGPEFSPSPSAQQNASRELGGRCPEDLKNGRKDAKERDKRLCEEKIVKTSKTTTFSSEKRGWSGREGPKIFKNRPRSGLEGLKSSIVT